MITRKILPLLLVLCSAHAIALPDAKITVKVVDEDGQPIEGVKAGISFRKPSGQTFGGSVGKGQSDLTDNEGLFTAQGATEPFVGIGASKEGYYRSSTEYNFKYNESGMIGFRKWQPWNPTVELVLKEIKEPIPLYAVKLNNIDIPELDKFIGFDLIARDWVVPYGSGTRKDFLFKLEIHHVKSMFEFDATLTLMFANPDDGILSVYDEPNKGSVLRLPHHAPVSGYQSVFVINYQNNPNKIYKRPYRDDQNFFFRVRSESDGKGNITSALYGKIHGPISFVGIGYKDIKTAQISFTYYLNPKSNDTNLEFNPQKNLFTDLKGWEAIGLTP